MYRFQIRAVTQPGETIALIGSLPEMGAWDIRQCVRLQTQGDRYPLWSVDLDLAQVSPHTPTAEYKYVRLKPNGQVEWEAWGTNRWVPIEADPLPHPIVVEDGVIGTVPPYPYGYFPAPVAENPLPQSEQGLKVVVIGSSVAMGCSAWMLRGWAWQLGQTLHAHFGHQLVNRSELGANVSSTIARFSQVVAPEQPDIVIIALSLGNEGLASSTSQQQRKAIQRRFENGLQQLIKMTRELGALPILGGVYPNGDYTSDHYAILQETHQRMMSWDVPVLDWLSALDDGRGRWKAGISFDAAHPNTKGHQLMVEAIALSPFQLTKADLANQPQPHLPEDLLVYQDDNGFHIFFRKADNSLRVINTTSHPYTLASWWQALQAAFQATFLPTGLYLAEHRTDTETPVNLLSLFLEENGRIETALTVPPATDLILHPVFHFFSPQQSQVLFHDGSLSLLKMSDRSLYVINESDHEYNIQPMWREVRAALKAMPAGVYEDPHNPEAPFRTLMNGEDGLESRVKAPAQSAIALHYKCSLADVSRIAIIPLGERCATRMLLYRLEDDGPAFPFDLTRTTKLADVADMIHNGFQDMWNPQFLHYNDDAKRIYHTKWTGLSFAHEVEESDDPVKDMTPVYERMQKRYSARSNRFWYTLQQCDKVLFVRTGSCDRPAVIDLVQKLEAKCAGKPFRLLLISPQPSDEFADLPNVLHYNLEFNPDRMYNDLRHWLDCAKVMREILNSLGISSKNLFWCPPHVPPVQPER